MVCSYHAVVHLNNIFKGLILCIHLLSPSFSCATRRENRVHNVLLCNSSWGKIILGLYKYNILAF